MKIEWLVTDVTAVGSPDRAEHDDFGMILGVIWPLQAISVVRKPCCDDVGIIS